jgi:hypothetical protein
VEQNLLACLRHSRDGLGDKRLFVHGDLPKATKSLLQHVLRWVEGLSLGHGLDGQRADALISLVQDSARNPSCVLRLEISPM